MAGKGKLAKGMMGFLHEALDPFLRQTAKAGTKEADELAKIAKQFDLKSITRDGDNLVITSKNGWRHHVDADGRTVRVETDNIKLQKSQGRSGGNQKRAGGDDRRLRDPNDPNKLYDDGGHFAGRRFGGPKHEFNHFAQDMNFNRGAYRSMENKLEALADKGVKVTIEPTYPKGSRRPDRLTVSWMENGRRKAKIFYNEPGGVAPSP